VASAAGAYPPARGSLLLTTDDVTTSRTLLQDFNWLATEEGRRAFAEEHAAQPAVANFPPPSLGEEIFSPPTPLEKGDVAVEPGIWPEPVLALVDELSSRVAAGKPKRAKLGQPMPGEDADQCHSREMKDFIDEHISDLSQEEVMRAAGFEDPTGLHEPRHIARALAMVKAHAITFSGDSTLRGGFQQRASFNTWLSGHEDLRDSPPVARFYDFFSHVQSEALLAAKRRGEQNANQNEVQERRAGLRAAKSAHTKLKFMTTHFGFDGAGLTHSKVLALVNESSGKARVTPSRPCSVRMVLSIEEMAINKNNVHSEFVQAFCAGLLAMLLASLRGKQARLSSFGEDFVSSGRRIKKGYCKRRKDPNPNRKEPSEFLLLRDGLSGDATWLPALEAVLAPIPRSRSLFRGHNGVGGDPFRATKWTDAAIGRDGIRIGFRLVLKHITGWDKDKLSAYTLKSIRAFMNEVARARGVPEFLRNEIGQWKGSQIASVSPTDPLAPRTIVKKSGARISVPDMYCTEAAEVHAARMIASQADGIALLTRIVPREQLPWEEGWDLIASHCPISADELRSLHDSSAHALESERQRQLTTAFAGALADASDSTDESRDSDDGSGSD